MGKSLTDARAEMKRVLENCEVACGMPVLQQGDKLIGCSFGIDGEVMSQIGTRATALLDNEPDIQAVFTGVAGSAQLRQVLARLDTRQQALILGHAVPMPVVVQTRPYGPELYAEVGHVEGEELQEKLAQNVNLLRGDDSFTGFD
jgi:hypothetical protein